MDNTSDSLGDKPAEATGLVSAFSRDQTPDQQIDALLNDPLPFSVDGIDSEFATPENFNLDMDVDLPAGTTEADFELPELDLELDLGLEEESKRAPEEPALLTAGVLKGSPAPAPAALEGRETPKSVAAPVVKLAVSRVPKIASSPAPAPYTLAPPVMHQTQPPQSTQSLQSMQAMQTMQPTYPLMSVAPPPVRAATSLDATFTSSAMAAPFRASERPEKRPLVAPPAKPQASSDPTTLADTLASAGVDLKEEEALLSSTMYIPAVSESATDVTRILSTQFLESHQLAPFMRIIARDSGIKQVFDQESDILGTVSAACEHWLTHVVTKTALLARHRKRTTKRSSTLNRNQTPTALRELAYKHKAEEDARSQKRVQLGIEAALDLLQRAGAEETLHRATNSTASMMTGAKRRKYAWLSNGANATPGGVGRNTNVRGDTGLRFRENRYSRGIVLRDVLEALDGERMGVNNSIIKGYAKLRD